MSDDPAELKREAAYYRELSEQLAAQLVKADSAASTLRHELEQKRRGFALMAKLAAGLHPSKEQEMFVEAGRRINPALNMQRTAILTPNADGKYAATVLQGYSADEARAVGAHSLTLPPVMTDPNRPVLITKDSPSDFLADIRAMLGLPYLVSAPVLVDGDVAAVLVTGRLREQKPFMQRLDKGDTETVQAMAAFLSAMLMQKRLGEIQHLANHDPLTGLPNLRLADDRLLQAAAAAKRDDAKAAVLYIDLDGFKLVNDSMGHQAGDTVLRAVSRRLQACVREIDTVARIGGDEFLVVLASVADRSGPKRVAQSILSALTRPIQCSEGLAEIGGSIGIALFPDDSTDPATLRRQADLAMYAVKKSGKNSWMYYQDGQTEQAHDRCKNNTND